MRRLVAVGMALIVVVSGWLALQAALGGAGGGPLTTTGSPSSPRLVSARAWVVRPGDTLWGIARAIGARGDIRPLVDRLSAEVGGRPLQVGQEIPVP
jgi:hypothetical protein